MTINNISGVFKTDSAAEWSNQEAAVKMDSLPKTSRSIKVAALGGRRQSKHSNQIDRWLSNAKSSYNIPGKSNMNVMTGITITRDSDCLTIVPRAIDNGPT